MIRASSAYKVVTNKPYFEPEQLEALELKMRGKVSTYDRIHLEEYSKTKGIATDASAIIKELQKEVLVKTDPLPDGAKTYLEELWLENHGFYNFSLREGSFQLQKGNLLEEKAIAEIGTLYKIKDIRKNVIRISSEELFISGECDVQYDDTIRDIKCPQSWNTFRDKEGISLTYKWQLVAYCMLYGKTRAFLDYVLLTTPFELIDVETRGYSEIELNQWRKTQEVISQLPLNKRVKTFELVTNLEEDIKFLKSRLAKSKEYYNSLTLEKCLKLNTNGFIQN